MFSVHDFLVYLWNMKKYLLSLIGLIGLSLSSFAGNVVTDSLESNILGTDVKYNVYLPDGYDSARHYPVIYLLHGLSDTHEIWIQIGRADWVADELIESGECVPCVIVMPGAGGLPLESTWNGYFNMPGWNYEDFFFTEFLPAVEKKYNAGGSKGQRAVMGLSMGGGGSVVYCQRHPEMFSSCYAMSAWLDNKESEVGFHQERKDCLYYVCKAVRDNSAVEFVRNADAAAIERLKTVKWFLNCGDDDSLLSLSVELHNLMLGNGVKCELRVCDGVHNWEYWHNCLRTSLPFASRNFF